MSLVTFKGGRVMTGRYLLGRLLLIALVAIVLAWLAASR